jgi:hypothetical protein
MATGKRDPSSHRTPEQIKKLSRGYNSTPEQIAKRSMRNQARAEMKKKVGAAAIAGKDIDHKKALRHGGSNAAGNLRIRAPGPNRGWEKEGR